MGVFQRAGSKIPPPIFCVSVEPAEPLDFTLQVVWTQIFHRSVSMKRAALFPVCRSFFLQCVASPVLLEFQANHL